MSTFPEQHVHSHGEIVDVLLDVATKALDSLSKGRVVQVGGVDECQVLGLHAELDKGAAHGAHVVGVDGRHVVGKHGHKSELGLMGLPTGSVNVLGVDPNGGQGD